MADLGSLVLAGVVSVAVLGLPGAAVAAALRLRGLPLLALAGPFSMALIGSSAVIADLFGIGFSIVPVIGLTALTAALALLLRRALGGLSAWGSWDAGSLVAVGTAVTAGLVAAAVTFRLVPGPDALSMTYDGVFHLNAVASILDGGSASSFTLYRLNHPGQDVEFYPAAWHAVTALTAQLTGSSVGLAMNASWIAVAVTVWPLGCLLLTHVLLGSSAWRAARLAVAGVLASLFTAFPALLLAWGTLYPTYLAYAQLPACVAVTVLVISLLSRITVDDSALSAARPRWRIVVLLIVCVVAVLFSHPRSGFSWVLLTGPGAIAAAVIWSRASLADPRRRKRWALTVGVSASALAVGVAGAAWYVARTFDLAANPISSFLTGGPATAREPLWLALVQGATATPMGTDGVTAFQTDWLLALVSIAAVIVVVRRHRVLVWVAVSAGLVVMLYGFAAGSNDDLAKLATAVWYKDKYRLLSLLPILLVPLVAHGIVVTASRLLPARRAAMIAIAAVTGLLAAVAWMGPSASSSSAAVGQAFEVPTHQKAGSLVDQDELALLSRLDEIVPEGERVVGNPWNGSILSWVVGDREPLFPHLTGEWNADQLLVAYGLDTAETNPAVCAALDRLDANYLFTDPELLWGGDAQAAVFAGIDRAPGSIELDEVARSGSSVLYRIAACAGL